MSSQNAILITINNQTAEDDTLQYLCSELEKLKYTVKETCNIENNCEYLIEKIQNLNDCFVFLVGNQHEVVYESLSKLFNEKLIVSKHLASIYKINITNNQDIKKITIPCNSKIYQNCVDGVNSVCVQLKNIFILSNTLNSVQLIFQKSLIPLLTKDSNKYVIGKNYILNCNQNGISNTIYEKLHNFNDSINIEQYCIVKNENDCELHVNLKSKNISTLVNCETVLENIIPKNIIMSINIEDSYWQPMLFLKYHSYVEEAIQIIKCCFTEYQPHEVFLCFNGGKDCTVLLYLTFYVLSQVHPLYKERLFCVYIQPKDPFKIVEEFVEHCQCFYQVELIKIKNEVKVGLEEVLLKHPNLTACLMGTRKTDPFSDTLSHFAMTDADWPQIMRVNPILDWSYSEVWKFLLAVNIPYCELYDQGYTSIGGMSNTIPNPALKVIKNGMEQYLPAYLLKDESLERAGRIKKQ